MKLFRTQYGSVRQQVRYNVSIVQSWLESSWILRWTCFDLVSENMGFRPISTTIHATSAQHWFLQICHTEKSLRAGFIITSFTWLCGNCHKMIEELVFYTWINDDGSHNCFFDGSHIIAENFLFFLFFWNSKFFMIF